MGIFSKLFGGKKENEKSEQKSEVFYAKQDEEMEKAYEEARTTFHYFWREVYWEYRRIIPAHDLAIVKVPFRQTFEGMEEPVVEQMWLSQIDFDGEKISGTLMNSPNDLTNVKKDDTVVVALNEISDWMFSSQGKTYGGFTIHVLRSKMGEAEREQHDKAWGLDFGDYKDIAVVYQQKEHPENLIEHPMSKNMEEKMHEFLKEHPNTIVDKDTNGQTMLHREAIAGNSTCVKILLEMGADKTSTSNTGKTPFDYATALQWNHLTNMLS